ncbi:MAG TPA: isochorismatase family cysteine hydrolase [Halobacteriales archaeon]|nr:isochorismatase family cysteine hydrolase [Halobacteriales archaeon]
MDRYVEPNPDGAAMLSIDVQRDFTDPGAPAEIPGTAEAAPAMGRLARAFRERSRPIVHVVRLYRRDGSNVDPCRRAAVEAGEEIVAPGSDGAELVSELKPSASVRLDAEALLSGELQRLDDAEWAMYKPRWGAFYRTPLADHLEALSVDTLVVCGCNFPNCPRTTVYEASERDFRVVLVDDAVSGTYERGLDEVAGIGVVVVDTDEVIDWLAGEPLEAVEGAGP